MPLTLDTARLLRPARGRNTSPRHLRIAVTTLFALDGAVFGSWAARIPDVAAQVGADETALGLALLCVSLGALASMRLTGALCVRLGSGVVAAGAGVLLCLAIALPGLTGSVAELAVALVVLGVATGAVNVAANSVGVRVQHQVGRPVLTSMHAAFSLGGLAGAGLGGLVAALPPAVHLVTVAAAGLLVAAAVAPTLAAGDGPRAARAEAPARGPRRLLVALGVIAGCTAYGEGAFTDWGALHLRETLAASPAAAAIGYAAFCTAMAVGRLAGARLVRALGETGVLAAGSLVATLGTLIAVLAPAVPVALAGFGLVGLGLANVFPLAIARAGALGGAGGVAVATSVGYAGLLGGPPAIGLVAGAVGIPVALSTVAALTVVGAVLSLAVGTGTAADRTRALGRAARPGLAPPVVVMDSTFRDRYRDVQSVLNGGRAAVPG